VNETYVCIVGNVVDHPVRRVTRSNTPFVTFRLASTVRRQDPAGSGEYVDAGTTFVNVTAFRTLGINVDASIRKGDPVVVHGRLRVNQWVSGERSGTSVDIDALTIGHDLSRGRSTFVRGGRVASYDDHDRLADPAVQEVRELVEASVSGDGLDGAGGENAGLGAEAHSAA
jgi:single-strand DNA-binding protein